MAINLSGLLSSPYTIRYYTKENKCVTIVESAPHVAQHVRYVLSEMRKMMSEPRDDDDVALGIDDDAIPEDDEFDTLEEKYGLK